MCGICGVYKYGDTNQGFDEALLIRMSDTIKHRGPDDAGTFLSGDRRLGFGFRRLSIVDLSPAGHQPMSTPDGAVSIVFNGEIYNHQVLRKEFEAKGYRYRSRSDTESILYAYQEYGLEFVHKLLGMFAIALWDERKRLLVLARDRIGIKPLYYTVADGQFIFGSEIKAIFQHPSVSREMDDAALDTYLTFLITPAPQTLYKNIRKLEPGHTMVVGPNGSLRIEQYWDPVPVGQQPTIDVDGTSIPHSRWSQGGDLMSEASCVQTIQTLLRQSVKDRMMSDVPFGVFLSGGIDSSTNVALMAELMDRPVDTFSVGFRDLERYNELGYARQIAQQFRTNHREIIIDQKMALDFLPSLIYHQDEPLADPVCIPLYFVSKLARDNGTIVVQVGEGSDEQFAGYQSMVRELRFYETFWKGYNALPSFGKNLVYSLADPLLRRAHQYLALDYIRKGLHEQELFWGGAVNFTETHKRMLLKDVRSSKDSPAHALARKWHQELMRRDPKADYLKRMVYLEFKNRLPELLLMRVDKMSMATSVESRVPFLDHRLVEYSMTIPDEFKIRKGEPKYILKKAVEGIVPDNIIYRKKQGFAAPVSEWLRNEWSSYAESAIMTSTLVEQGPLRGDFIKKMFDLHRRRKMDAGQNIWNLLNLVLWHRHWIERKTL